MTDITFTLNGTPMRVTGQPPTRTLLDWLREDRRLTGTKEGCNEGDCGACTVWVKDARGVRALNACILFLPQVHGCAVRTVEGMAAPDGTLHPVQQAMIDHHGSQCGFCTPGFVVAMAVAQANGETDHDTALAGNLCRCTGYAPIVRAAEAAAAAPVPGWLDDPLPEAGDPGVFMPESADALAAWYAAHPDAVLIGGATDVGLWVTKGMRDLAPVAFLARCADLRRVEVGADVVRIGAAVTLAELLPVMERLHPSFAALIRRYGGPQVRAAATVGGNIANGSPIGDSMPPLIALGATLHLRHGDRRRAMPLEDFFLAYGRQDRAPGEFVEAVSFPRQPDRLRVWKVSKRFDDDISAVCGAFNLTVEGGIVRAARVAFGGMAGVPARARAVEAALTGRAFDAAAVAAAQAALAEDFRPIDDHRASAAYRLEAARGLIRRCLLAERGSLAAVAAAVAEVAP
jgi:xanthine dehydrogenase small subunit